MAGDRNRARLLEIADIGADHRQIGMTRGKGLGRIEHAAGILHLEPDGRIRGGEAAGDDRRDLLASPSSDPTATASVVGR